MKLKIGGHSANVLLERMQTSGIGLNDHAKAYFDRLRFHVTLASRTLHISMLTPDQLGMANGGRLSEIYARARNAGYRLCPADAAIYLRLALDSQQASTDSTLSSGKCPDGAINVAAEPIYHDSALHRGLYLRNAEGRLWLRGYECDDEYIWPAHSVFAFADAGISSALSK